MPPKFKFTKEEIIYNALTLVRSQGFNSLTARALGNRLGASTKPIFGLFGSMEEVKDEVLAEADRIYHFYLEREIKSGEYPPYKASGMAYIRFAMEEAELFKLLFMRDRSGENIEESHEEIRPQLEMIIKNLGISEEKALLFHLEMWVFVHGIATMTATSYLKWDRDFISSCLTDMYEGLKHRFRGNL